MAASIHPSAVVDPGAELGADVTIGPFVVIESDVIIGSGSRIDSHACIKQYTRMGARNRVHSHAVVGGESQDLKFHGEVTWLRVGDDNTIREFATLHRGTAGGGGETRVGNSNLLMAYTHVAHDCVLGNHIIMSNGATLAGHVNVGDHAIIGGLSAVHQFTRIGRNAFVGGMTGVAQDLPPWMLAAGARALVHGPNLVGLRRVGANRETVAAMKHAFRMIWRSELLRQEALEALSAEYAHMPEVMEFIEFIQKSERGLCPAEKMLETEQKKLDAEGETA